MLEKILLDTHPTYPLTLALPPFLLDKEKLHGTMYDTSKAQTRATTHVEAYPPWVTHVPRRHVSIFVLVLLSKRGPS